MTTWIDYRHCNQPYIAERGIGRSTIAAGRPAQAYRLAASAVRKWPLSSVGYTTALATLLSIRSYQRTIRRCKNACGRFVYRVLRIKP